jgi:hypothetical protein
MAPERGLVTGCCDDGNELFGPVEYRKFIDRFEDFEVLKDCAAWKAVSFQSLCYLTTRLAVPITCQFTSVF